VNAQKLGISEQIQHYERDTQGLYGPIEVNELGVTLGHKTAGLTKENAANLAGFNGVITTSETVQFPEENSLEWAGAPAIILRHFCGVAA
jgi:hypothetical protein